MELIKCPECNRQISNAADSCPSCGYPISKATKKCAHCGETIPFAANFCPKCFVVQLPQKPKTAQSSRQPEIKPKHTKPWYVTYWYVIAVVVVLLLMGTLRNRDDNPPQTALDRQKVPSSPTREKQDLAVEAESLPSRLASADGYSSKSTVARYERVLKSLERKTGNTQEEIADMTAKTKLIYKRDFAKDIKLIDIMEGVDKSIPAGSNAGGYAFFASLFITMLGEME